MKTQLEYEIWKLCCCGSLVQELSSLYRSLCGNQFSFVLNLCSHHSIPNICLPNRRC